MSGEQMQAKITAARREAEGLKDKIKRRKDELADTTCKILHLITERMIVPPRCRRLLLFWAQPSCPSNQLVCIHLR
jgi:hypothetical protein